MDEGAPLSLDSNCSEHIFDKNQKILFFHRGEKNFLEESVFQQKNNFYLFMFKVGTKFSGFSSKKSLFELIHI